MKRIILSLFCLFFLSFSGFSQTTVESSVELPASEWTLLTEADEYRIEYKNADCPMPSQGTHNEYVLLRITNKTDQAINLKYDLENYYNGRCTTCTNNDNDLTKFVTVPASSTYEAECTTRDRAVRIFYRMVKPKTRSLLTDFRITNVSVSY